MSDWITGPGNYLALGIYVEVGQGHGLTLTYGLPNDSANTRLWALNWLRTRSLRR